MLPEKRKASSPAPENRFLLHLLRLPTIISFFQFPPFFHLNILSFLISLSSPLLLDQAGKMPLPWVVISGLQCLKVLLKGRTFQKPGSGTWLASFLAESLEFRKCFGARRPAFSSPLLPPYLPQKPLRRGASLLGVPGSRVLSLENGPAYSSLENVLMMKGIAVHGGAKHSVWL